MALHHKYKNPAYIHHRNSRIVDNAREIVFGVQDGMVSTLGAITGVAVGSGDIFVVLLAGIAIISVESISMGIGAYTSSRGEKKLMERMLDEECQEIINYPKEEKAELRDLFIADGWSPQMADKMVAEIGGNKKLMLREMAYRELHIAPDQSEHPGERGVFMFGAYIAGGLVPLGAYFFFPIPLATHVSIPVTLAGLFILGSSIGHYTKEAWYKTGAHMFVFGGVALLVGYGVGLLSHNFLV